MTSGNTNSCGCLLRDAITSHGGSDTPVYKVWHAMLERCRNPKGPEYRDYGGRGITVEPRWNDFATFAGDMGQRPDGMTLERFDVNGNYGPGNCRWATPLDQANNRRNNRRITIAGTTLTLAQWATRAGISKSGLRYRLDTGMSPETAISSAPNRRQQRR